MSAHTGSSGFAPGELEALISRAGSQDVADAAAASAELRERAHELPDSLLAAVDHLRYATGEARLVYAAKASEAEILSTPAVPLQVVKRYGPRSEHDWTNKLVYGDNLGVLKALLEAKQRGELKNADGTDGFRVCYIDPPFATKREFEARSGQVAYKDKVDGAEFVEFLRQRLVLIHRLLADDGTLYLHLDTKKVHYAKVALDEVFGSKNYRNEVIWQRTSSKGLKMSSLPANHDSILIYGKSPGVIWNEIRLPYDLDDLDEKTLKKYCYHDESGRRYRLDNLLSPSQASQSSLKYELMGVTRVWRWSPERMSKAVEAGIVIQTAPGRVPQLKRYLDEQLGRLVGDVWTDIPPVNSQAGERSGYPTQKPGALLERVIKASSNPGDLVLDCFMGSGVTCRVAERLGRRWVGVDVGKLSVATATRDILKLDGTRTSKGEKPHQLAPFDVCQAGLYDLPELLTREHEDWRSFALRLYGCTDERHTIGALELDGRRLRGEHALVPAFKTADGKLRTIDRTTLEQWASQLSGSSDATVMVIIPDQSAPTLLDRELVGTVAFQILRIPPSLSEAFAGLEQPTSADRINQLIDARGFDVHMPPIVEVSVTPAENLLAAGTLVIDRFEATPASRPGEPPEETRSELAMVLVDYQHDSDVFDFDQVIFADEIDPRDKKERAAATPDGRRWTVELASEARDGVTAVTFVDVFGNETTILLQPEQFEASSGGETRA